MLLGVLHVLGPFSILESLTTGNDFGGRSEDGGGKSDDDELPPGVYLTTSCCY